MYLLFKESPLAFENKQKQKSEVCHPGTRIFLSNIKVILFSAFGKSAQKGAL